MGCREASCSGQLEWTLHLLPCTYIDQILSQSTTNMSTSPTPGASLVDVEDVVAGGAVGQLPRQRRAAVRVKYLLQHEQLELVHGDGLLHHDRGHHAIRQQYLCKQA